MLYFLSLHGVLFFILFYSPFKYFTLLFSNYFFYDSLYSFSFLSSAPRQIFKHIVSVQRFCVSGLSFSCNWSWSSLDKNQVLGNAAGLLKGGSHPHATSTGTTWEIEVSAHFDFENALQKNYKALIFIYRILLRLCSEHGTGVWLPPTWICESRMLSQHQPRAAFTHPALKRCWAEQAFFSSLLE